MAFKFRKLVLFVNQISMTMSVSMSMSLILVCQIYGGGKTLTLLVSRLSIHNSKYY